MIVEENASGRQQSPSIPRRIFYGPTELRAGWRLLIFLAVLAAIVTPLVLLGNHYQPIGFRGSLKEMTPGILVFYDSIKLGVVLLAAFIMSRIEKRKVGAYGLPLRGGTLRNFWIGTAWGFGALSALLGVMWLAHDYHAGHVALRGRELIYYPLAWGVAFLLLGLAEEFTFRGYGQFTLTTGIGFWPAAILFSLLFGFGHSGNSGEQFIGLVQVVVIALFFCFTLWRTGTLWFAVGYHAAWDWGQTFFYGTPNSGLLGRGHLLNPMFKGPSWLTGGSVGPEGSYLHIPLVLVSTLLFVMVYRKRMPYPDRSALKIP
jgi:membrane protease YdiL (CAAX protease family)